VIGLGVIAIFFGAVYLNKYTTQKGYKNGFTALIIVFVIINLIYTLIYIFCQDCFTYIPNPIVPLIFSIGILGWFYYDSRKTENLEINSILFGIGSLFLMVTIFTLLQWQSVSEWTDAYNDAHFGVEVSVKPLAFVLILGLAIMSTLLIYNFAKYTQYKFPSLKPYLLPINVALFFGHLLDASATFIAIDYYDYFEKHVVPTLFIDLVGTAAVMFVLKIVLIGVVIYVIDVKFRDDLKSSPNLVGLVKACVLILGLAPGIRDAVRLGMGL
jgi:uncharacterized membrane protein